jgi:P4 family phage/plasmid primase-like protien
VKKEQKLDIWTGTGSNGKSVTIDFLSKSLGDYFDSPPITMLTRKRGGSANASPDIAKLKGKRVVCFLEPECDDTLQTSMMKQFFGNDWIEARGLFKDPIKFKPQASGFLACNDLPKIPSTDGGTWRRIRVLEFKSKFVKNPSGPNEFKMDPKLVEQIDYLAESFISVLIHYWSKFYTSSFIINEPPDVSEFTKRYQTESDIYLEFVQELIEETNNQKDRVTLKTLWDVFKIWHKDNCSNMKPVGKPEFKKHMEAKLGPLPSNRGWVGKVIRDLDENDKKENFLV